MFLRFVTAAAKRRKSVVWKLCKSGTIHARWSVQLLKQIQQKSWRHCEHEMWLHPPFFSMSLLHLGHGFEFWTTHSALSKFWALMTLKSFNNLHGIKSWISSSQPKQKRKPHLHLTAGWSFFDSSTLMARLHFSLTHHLIKRLLLTKPFVMSCLYLVLVSTDMRSSANSSLRIVTHRYPGHFMLSMLELLSTVFLMYFLKQIWQKEWLHSSSAMSYKLGRQRDFSEFKTFTYFRIKAFQANLAHFLNLFLVVFGSFAFWSALTRFLYLSLRGFLRFVVAFVLFVCGLLIFCCFNASIIKLFKKDISSPLVFC